MNFASYVLILWLLTRKIYYYYLSIRDFNSSILLRVLKGSFSCFVRLLLHSVLKAYSKMTDAKNNNIYESILSTARNLPSNLLLLFIVQNSHVLYIDYDSIFLRCVIVFLKPFSIMPC